MQFPHMLIMRNQRGGMIWQAYTVNDGFEASLLTDTAQKNGFIVEQEPSGYTDETWPGWRDTKEWKEYSESKRIPS